MGSDRTDKPFNYKAAKCVLHCNNCITLLPALALIVSGGLNEIGGTDAVLKYTLCSKLTAIGGGVGKGGMANGDMVHANSTAETAQTTAGKALLAAEALCRPSGEDGAAGHCKPWQNGHNDCDLGFYCDEDFVCWDCDFVTPTAVNPEPPCDAYDADDAKYDAFTTDDLIARGPCHRCYDSQTNPDAMPAPSATQLVATAAPDGADFMGSTADMSIGFGIAVLLSSIFGFLGDAYKRRTLLFIHHFVLLVLGVAMVYAVVFCLAFKSYAHDMLRTYWPCDFVTFSHHFLSLFRIILSLFPSLFPLFCHFFPSFSLSSQVDSELFPRRNDDARRAGRIELSFRHGFTHVQLAFPLVFP